MATKVAELVAELGLEIDGGQFAAGTKAIEGIANALKALAVFKGAMVFKSWLMQTAEVADAAKKMGDRFAMSAETVQELTYAAKANDTSLEALQGGIKRVDRLLSGFGGKKGAGAAAALKELGVNAKEFKNLAFDEKIDKLADGFKALDEQKQLQVAQKLGLGTGPLLLMKQGAEGIRELREEARLLGVVVSDEAAASFEQWNDEVARVKAAIQGMKNDAVVALLPTLREATASLFAWIKANRELIRQRLEQVLKLIVQAAQGFVKVLGIAYKLVEQLAPVIDNVFGAVTNLLGVLTGASSELEALAVAIGAFFALANLPIILLMALIAAAILVIDDLWSGLQGGDSVIGELFDAFGEALGDTGVGRLIMGVKAGFEAVFEFLKDKVAWLIEKGEAIGNLFYNLVHGDTQFQAEAAIDPRAAMLRRIPGYTGIANPAGFDKVIQQDASARGSLDKVVTAADTGIDRVIKTPYIMPQQAAMDRVAAQADPGMLDRMTRMIPIPPPAVNVAAPQLRVDVRIEGKAEAEAADTLVGKMRDFWEEAMRDAQVATGARGGRVP